MARAQPAASPAHALYVYVHIWPLPGAFPSTHRVLLGVLSGQVGTRWVISGQEGTHEVLLRLSFGTVRGTHGGLAHACMRLCAADYVLGPANTNACPAGYSKITDVTTCEAAAIAVAKPYSQSYLSSTKPSGCYLGLVIQAVYINPHPTGAAAADAQPLCKGTGAQPPRAHLRGAPWGGVPRGVIPWKCPLPH